MEKESIKVLEKKYSHMDCRDCLLQCFQGSLCKERTSQNSGSCPEPVDNIPAHFITMTPHDRHYVSNHRQLNCLLNSLFRYTWKTHQSSELLALGWTGTVDFPHKSPVTRKCGHIIAWYSHVLILCYRTVYCIRTTTSCNVLRALNKSMYPGTYNQYGVIYFMQQL